MLWALLQDWATHQQSMGDIVSEFRVEAQLPEVGV
jgi:hypothetical protein